MGPGEKLADRPPSVAIRPATIDDLDRIYALQARAFPDDPHVPSRAGLEERLRSRSCEMFIGARNGGIDGYVILINRPLRPWTAIDYIVVSEDRRSGGIGQMLLEKAAARASRRNLRLFVRPSNTRAIAFYERNGFKVTGRRANNYHDGEDAVIMMRRMR